MPPSQNEISNLQARIAELEIDATYLRETVESLNQTITQQWQEIDRLSKMLEQILTHLRGPKDGSDAGGEEPPPPHY